MLLPAKSFFVASYFHAFWASSMKFPLRTKCDATSEISERKRANLHWLV
jgi:hypothetical protein